MDAETEKMAREFFGYGRWGAPYWFIGPEPAGDSHTQRSLAFRILGKDGLCDCKEFHNGIGVDWSGELQKTWKRQILILENFLGEDGKVEFPDKGNPAQTLLNYQWECWGSRDGNTCVIELRGLNTKGNSEYRKICDAELGRRIEYIKEKLKTSEEKPKLVVMYGKTDQGRWEPIADHILAIDRPYDRPLMQDSTTYVFAYHPNARGHKGDYWLKDSYWEDLGKRARRESNER